MLVEIVREDCAVESRNANTKNGPQTFYHQTAYLHLPGQAYPSRFRVPVRGPADAYQPGRYTVSPGSYRINPYGDLEINRFDFSLQPAAAAVEAKRA